MAELTGFSLNFGFLGLEGTWKPDESEKKAAWEMYVELVTRISVAEACLSTGSIREALSSLYALFGITREILKKYGPVVAQPKGQGTLSFGIIAVLILNRMLRPFLVKWHPQLLSYEGTRDSQTAIIDHEQAWEHQIAFYTELEKVQNDLTDYADALAKVAGVPSIHDPEQFRAP